MTWSMFFSVFLGSLVGSAIGQLLWYLWFERLARKWLPKEWFP